MARPLMISVSGIRGVVGEGLSPDVISNVAAAAGTFFGRGDVPVGRDSRRSGPMVRHAVFSGLISVGCHPVDLGICATPVVETAVQNSSAVGGIIITASHNPIEWNALKLLTSEGIFLDAEQGARVQDIVRKGDYAFTGWDTLGEERRWEGAVDDYLDRLLALDLINADLIRSRGIAVAYDCVNGAGGTVLPLLFERLGCKAVALNQEPTGLFAHAPEPVPENLDQLCRLVREKKLQGGFAVDPDVDRCAIVDENGHPLGEEYTLALTAAYVLSKKKGPVVVNMSTSRAVEDIATALGLETMRTPVGEIHVAKKMLQVDGVIGGEGNGGVILPAFHPGRDAPLAIALTLQALAEREVPLSSLRRELPAYNMCKRKLEIGGIDPKEIISRLQEIHKKEKLNTLDGLKLDYPEYWVHVRASNTEPIIRIIAEAVTAEDAAEHCRKIISEIEEISRQ